MNNLRQRKYLFALLALLLVFAACKGESPTAPPPVSSPGAPGTPPAGATVTLSVSNPNPLTDSSTTITATVTVGGQPAPAGTAVEFGTTLGRFEDTGLPTSLRTTNAQGQAVVSLTSAAAGTAQVTVVVNNVVQRTTVTFTARPVTPPPPSTGATITAISPQFGPFEGGTLVTLTGTNFRTPVRVFFDLGNGDLREGLVTSVTPTSIQVITPRVEIPAGQTLESTVVAFIEQGTPNEQRIASPGPFTFRRAQLTPAVVTLSPDSGPLEGGTQVTIFGDGFEAPVQVSFGDIPTNTWIQVQVVNVTFNRIVVMTPPSRDVSPTGALTLGGHVDVRVLNINSATMVTLDNAFRYSPLMQITSIGPTEGPFTGGTRVTIDGIGFDDPVAVSIGGVAAQPISVSGTQVIAITSAVAVTGCNDVIGPISVTNINTGASIISDVTFIYRVPQPIIVSASSPVQPGGTITVVVFNAFGFPRLRLDDRVLSITSVTENANGTTTFTAVIPTNIQLDQEACTSAPGASAPQPTSFDITYESATTGCTDTLADGVVVEPLPVPQLTFIPNGFTPFTATFVPGNPAATPPTSDSITASAFQTVNIVNTGAATLTVNSITQSGAGCSSFLVSHAPPPFDLNPCEAAPVIVRYVGPTPPATGTQTCTLIVDTNAGTRSLNLTGTTQ
ncbi:MAG TPA: IPT/TIG domain-containing protein [Thermoanaerobaculia bacterium]|nr:IPT/TIG domain-containing protein [Thermoanaerobaculia bacterium]